MTRVLVDAWAADAQKYYTVSALNFLMCRAAPHMLARHLESVMPKSSAWQFMNWLGQAFALGASGKTASNPSNPQSKLAL